jgi:hypothetical protein
MAIKHLIALCLLLASTYAESNPEAEAEADADAFFPGYGYHGYGYHANHYRPYARAYPRHHRPYVYRASRPYFKKYVPYKPKVYSYKPIGPVYKAAPEPVQYAAPAAPAPVPAPAPARAPTPVPQPQPAFPDLSNLSLPKLKTFPAVPVAEESYEHAQPIEAVPYVDDSDIEVIGAAPAAPAAPQVVQTQVSEVVPEFGAKIAPLGGTPTPGVVATQYHAQDEFGNVEYGYSNPNSQKQERRDAYGNVIGGYSYQDGTGYPKHVSYVADDFGFRITAANNLPVAAR